MPKQTLENLITTLHERFADDLVSPQQKQLIQAIESHIHDSDGVEPADPNIQETLALLVEDIEEQHPQTAAIVREVMEALKNMGI